ncbi:WD40 repeat-like protein [Massarina eburnea CBS 473.64]|uniref:WD40 repeat-like protein n=1 Tax=Massarina eburnea CBS 473.64 TaxID=1395130 RepID=A0A6A6SEF6_9PLEO|nr:WD40 repeat-like protein [Massarina eburnea CBS 473.64]
MSSQFELAQNPAEPISAVKFAATTNTRLLVASWDRHVYLYDTHAEPGGKLLRRFEHRAPVLDVCFGRDEDEAFSCSLDWEVRRIDLATGAQTVLSTHSAGVRNILFSPAHNLLVSAAWDSTLHVHDLSRPGEFSTVTLPSKPFSLSASPTKLVVAMASRAVNIYELSALVKAAHQAKENVHVEPWQRRESSMKYMTRAVACMPNDQGYASSSIEGRVAVEWFDPSETSQARKYAFKCHRQTQDGQDIVYPVHALAYHPVHGTFASGGGDGIVALWDGVAKRRIRQYQRFPASVQTIAFSGDGKYVAVGVSPGFEDAVADVPDGVIKVFIRELTDTEAQGKKHYSAGILRQFTGTISKSVTTFLTYYRTTTTFITPLLSNYRSFTAAPRLSFLYTNRTDLMCWRNGILYTCPTTQSPNSKSLPHALLHPVHPHTLCEHAQVEPFPRPCPFLKNRMVMESEFMCPNCEKEGGEWVKRGLKERQQWDGKLKGGSCWTGWTGEQLIFLFTINDELRKIKDSIPSNFSDKSSSEAALRSPSPTCDIHQDINNSLPDSDTSPTGSNMSSSADSEGAHTYASLIADMRKRGTNQAHLCHLPDANDLTFNNLAIDTSFPLTGATKRGMLVGHYDPRGDGNEEAVYAYAHNHIAHKGKKTTSISYFLTETNDQIPEERLDKINFIKPFNAAYNMPGALFAKRVRLLILFYFMEKGLLDRFNPLTDDIKLFKAAVMSVAQIAGALKQRPFREYGTLRAPGVVGSQATPFVAPPRATPFKTEPKDDEPEFVASIEKAPGAKLSVMPVPGAGKKDAAGANRSQPVDLTESERTTRSSKEATQQSRNHIPSTGNVNTTAIEQGAKRARSATVAQDSDRTPKRPALDEGLSHFKAFVQHIRGRFTEEDHEQLQAENVRLKNEIDKLKMNFENEKKDLEDKLAAEIEECKKLEAERDVAKKANQSLNDLKDCIVDMAEQIKGGENDKESERLMKEADTLRGVEGLKEAEVSEAERMEARRRELLGGAARMKQ